MTPRTSGGPWLAGFSLLRTLWMGWVAAALRIVGSTKDEFTRGLDGFATTLLLHFVIDQLGVEGTENSRTREDGWTTAAFLLDRIPVLFLSFGAVNGTARATAADLSKGATTEFGFLETNARSFCWFGLTNFKVGYIKRWCERETKVGESGG